MDSGCDSVHAFPLVLAERSLSAIDDVLPIQFTFLGALVAAELGVFLDEEVRL